MNTRARLFTFALLIAVQSVSWASEICFESAGRFYNIDSDLIRAMAWQESAFRVDAKNVNAKDGSVDLGLMQINQLHYARLGKMGISRDHLQRNGCLNVFVGTFILAEIFNQHGMGWNAVGMYNAGPGGKASTIRNRERYAILINAKLRAVKLARHPTDQQPEGWLPLTGYQERFVF